MNSCMLPNRIVKTCTPNLLRTFSKWESLFCMKTLSEQCSTILYMEGKGSDRALGSDGFPRLDSAAKKYLALKLAKSVFLQTITDACLLVPDLPRTPEKRTSNIKRANYVKSKTVSFNKVVFRKTPQGLIINELKEPDSWMIRLEREEREMEMELYEQLHNQYHPAYNGYYSQGYDYGYYEEQSWNSHDYYYGQPEPQYYPPANFDSYYEVQPKRQAFGYDQTYQREQPRKNVNKRSKKQRANKKRKKHGSKKNNMHAKSNTTKNDFTRSKLPSDMLQQLVQIDSNRTYL